MSASDSQTSSVRRYLSLLRERPDAFRNPDPKGIVILKKKAEITIAESHIAEQLLAQGYPPEWSRAGVYYEDRWLYVVRDVVRFPDGTPNTYHRLILKQGEHGVIIFPIYQDKILLLRHFRHGIRDWSLELPRGGPDDRNTLERNVSVELAEEIDGSVSCIRYIGETHTNTGILTASMHVYVAYLDRIGSPNLREGISATILVTPSELEHMIESAKVTDSHTIVGYTLARLHGLF